MGNNDAQTRSTVTLLQKYAYPSIEKRQAALQFGSGMQACRHVACAITKAACSITKSTTCITQIVSRCFIHKHTSFIYMRSRAGNDLSISHYLQCNRWRDIHSYFAHFLAAVCIRVSSSQLWHHQRKGTLLRNRQCCPRSAVCSLLQIVVLIKIANGPTKIFF